MTIYDLRLDGQRNKRLQRRRRQQVEGTAGGSKRVMVVSRWLMAAYTSLA